MGLRGNVDTVYTPTEQGYPPGGGLFSFVGVVIYTFLGTINTRETGFGTVNRFDDDFDFARNIWGLPIINPRVIPILDTDFGWSTSNLRCGDRTFTNEPLFRRLQERRTADSVPADWITVWYAPTNFQGFSETRGGTVGCAYPNRRWPLEEGPELQNIIIGNGAATPSGRDALAHELGHIFFATIPNRERRMFEGQMKGDWDPTGISGSPHSALENNIMSPNGGFNLTTLQRETALDSRLFPRGVQLP